MVIALERKPHHKAPDSKWVPLISNLSHVTQQGAALRTEASSHQYGVQQMAEGVNIGSGKVRLESCILEVLVYTLCWKPWTGCVTLAASTQLRKLA